eukprot:745890-Hanusia_phi.AAC.1
MALDDTVEAVAPVDHVVEHVLCQLPKAQDAELLLRVEGQLLVGELELHAREGHRSVQEHALAVDTHRAGPLVLHRLAHELLLPRLGDHLHRCDLREAARVVLAEQALHHLHVGLPRDDAVQHQALLAGLHGARHVYAAPQLVEERVVAVGIRGPVRHAIHRRLGTADQCQLVAAGVGRVRLAWHAELACGTLPACTVRNPGWAQLARSTLLPLLRGTRLSLLPARAPLGPYPAFGDVHDRPAQAPHRRQTISPAAKAFFFIHTIPTSLRIDWTKTWMSMIHMHEVDEQQGPNLGHCGGAGEEELDGLQQEHEERGDGKHDGLVESTDHDQAVQLRRALPDGVVAHGLELRVDAPQRVEQHEQTDQLHELAELVRGVHRHRPAGEDHHVGQGQGQRLPHDDRLCVVPLPLRHAIEQDEPHHAHERQDPAEIDPLDHELRVAGEHEEHQAHELAAIVGVPERPGEPGGQHQDAERDGEALDLLEERGLLRIGGLHGLDDSLHRNQRGQLLEQVRKVLDGAGGAQVAVKEGHRIVQVVAHEGEQHAQVDDHGRPHARAQQRVQEPDHREHERALHSHRDLHDALHVLRRRHACRLLRPIQYIIQPALDGILVVVRERQHQISVACTYPALIHHQDRDRRHKHHVIGAEHRAGNHRFHATGNVAQTPHAPRLAESSVGNAVQVTPRVHGDGQAAAAYVLKKAWELLHEATVQNHLAIPLGVFTVVILRLTGVAEPGDGPWVFGAVPQTEGVP